MSAKFETFLIDYIKSRVGVFKKYLLAALNNRDSCYWYVEQIEGMMMPGSDVKNCQLLRDANLFTEDTKVSRNGRTTYKIYCLTEEGKKTAQELREESIVSEDELPNQATFS